MAVSFGHLDAPMLRTDFWHDNPRFRITQEGMVRLSPGLVLDEHKEAVGANCRYDEGILEHAPRI